jgi:hypothetical protein
MGLSKIATDILDKLIEELKKEDNMNKIEDNVISPIKRYTFYRILPYLLVLGFIVFLNLLISLFTLHVILRDPYIPINTFT